MILHAQPWHDPVVEACGHPVQGPYVERYWLPILGPSAILMMRRLVNDLTLTGGYDLDVGVLAAALGLGHGLNEHSPVMRTIRRLSRFGCVEARPAARPALYVRLALAPLTTRQAARLPEALAAELREGVPA